MAENMAYDTASWAPVQIEPRIRPESRENGNCSMNGRDFRHFRPATPEIGSLETVCGIAKARHWRPLLRWVEAEPRPAALPGWGGRIRTSAWGDQNPLPYHFATPP